MHNAVNYQKWNPERIFFSHATKDNNLTEKVKDSIEKIINGCEVYIAERNLVGKPLIEKLKEEMLDCNALIVSWTNNTNIKSTSQIISFEVGMAYSLGLPVYILFFDSVKISWFKLKIPWFKLKEIPWFFKNITDYEKVNSRDKNDIEKALKKIEPISFIHPLDIQFPKKKYPGAFLNKKSSNIDVVQEDGSLKFEAGFNDILHYFLINNRKKPEKNVRFLLRFPDVFKITYDPGSLEGEGNVKRNEFFYCFQLKYDITIYWPSFGIRKTIFEIKIEIPSDITNLNNLCLDIAVSSDNIVGYRRKKIPIEIISFKENNEIS